MKLTACGSCGHGELATVLDLGSSPLADDFPTTPDLDAQRWSLQLLHCPACTLVQLSEVVPDEILWGGDYGFYTGASPVVVAEMARYAQALMAAHPAACARGVVEVASNDGTLLHHFAVAGYPTLGIDPAKGPAAAAQAKGLEVWVEPFTTTVAERILARHGTQGLLVANHVIAHVADLNDFLNAVHTVLDPVDGVAVIEFQYLPDLLLGNQFDHLYHEHRRFFTLTSLAAAFGGHGLQVTDAVQNDRQGGSLRVTIRRRRRMVPSSAVGALLTAEAWLSEPGALAGLQGRADRIRLRLRSMLEQLRADGLRVAGYGAAAKATTLLNWCDITPDLVQYMVDITPTKHGRYMPGVGIPIISPTADSRAPDVYLLTVHNYLTAVLRREQRFTTAGGRWLVPIPQPVLL